MQVDPGELNKKIQIIRVTDGESYDDEGHLVHYAENGSLTDSDNDEILDSDGDAILTDKEVEIVRSCWAKVSSTSGTELIKAGQEVTDDKKRFLVRWTPIEITEAMFVRYKSEILGIVRVNTYSDDKRYMEIWTDKKKAVT